ncbi:MAG TPA: Ig-like domain-containing protein [Polyangiaceae bacterium]|nr:Ig-like domain-containing protein [Polyangiaceae bacterium]
MSGLFGLVRRNYENRTIGGRTASELAQFAPSEGALIKGRHAALTRTIAAATVLAMGAGCAPDLKQSTDNGAQGATAGNAGRGNQSSADAGGKSSSAGGAAASQQDSRTVTTVGGGSNPINVGGASSGGASTGGETTSFVNGGATNGSTTQSPSNGGGPSDGGAGGTTPTTGVGGVIATGGSTVTGSVPDTTPPELKSKAPLTTAEPTDVLQVTFSEPLNCSTVTSSSFQVRDSSAAVVGTLNCSGSTVTFRPREGFVFTVSYTVSLTSGITDPSGNSLKDAPQSWTFAGREGKWEPASIVLDSAAAGTGPEAAFSLNGDAIVVWSRANGLVRNASSSRYTDSTDRWSGAIPIFTHPEDSCSDLHVGGDDSGNFVAAWAQGVAGFSDMADAVTSRMVPGDVWETPKIVSTDTTTTSTIDIHLTVHPTGDASLVWLQHGLPFSTVGEKGPPWGSRYSVNSKAWSVATKLRSENCDGVCAAGFGDGTVMTLCGVEGTVVPITWKAGQSPSTGTAIANGWPEAVRADGAGNFLALWLENSQALFGDRWAANTSSWGSPVKIRDFTALTSRPTFAANARGAAVAVWANTVQGETVNTLMGAHLRGASTSWNWFIEISDGDVAYPSVGIDAAGNAIAAWTEGQSVWASRFVVTSATPAWTTPIRLSQNNASYANVAMHPSGRALLVWEEAESASSESSTIRAKWFR